eukprot:2805399-Pleurochrysis_carterae.AAC.1
MCRPSSCLVPTSVPSADLRPPARLHTFASVRATVKVRLAGSEARARQQINADVTARRSE